MKIFIRLLTFLRPFSLRIILAILLGMMMIASNMGLLGMAAYVISSAALGPLLITLTLPIYMVRLMGISRVITRYLERLVSHNVTFRLLAQLRSWTYARLEPLAPAQLQELRTGDLLTRLVADIDELQNLYLRIISPFIVALAIVAFTFAIFSAFSAPLAWTALLFLVAAGFAVPLLALRLARGSGLRRLHVRAALNTQLIDGLQGVQDLLACGRASDQQQKISVLDRSLEQLQRRMARVAGLQLFLNDLLMNLAVLVLLLLAIPLVTKGTIDGLYLAFLALFILASFEAVQPLAPAFQFLGQSLAAGERLFKVTDARPQIVDPVQPLLIPADIRSSGLALTFEQLHFGYQSTEVLHGVSFSVPPGGRVAIVGPSGSGKSTLLRLLLRFWDPASGSIQLGGQDIRSYSLKDLRSLISVVDQETYLFNDTIRGNLLLARPGASDSQLEEALEQAQLSDFVQQLPQGLNTWIGEHGLRFSGGERQRLAIARALLKDAPLLILDEATANLDPLTEQALLETLSVLMQQRTTLMITHRLVSMERMDEVLVFDGGQIIERGSHVQLAQNAGFYRQMLAIQNGLLV